MIRYEDFILINILLGSLGNPITLVWNAPTGEIRGFAKDGTVYCDYEVFIVVINLAKKALLTGNRNEAFSSLLTAVKTSAKSHGINVL